MTPSILRAEQVIWLTLVDMMGGPVVKPLTSSVMLINGLETSNTLKYDLDDKEASTKLSLGRIGSFSMADIFIKACATSSCETKLQMELKRWKNPDFKVCIDELLLHLRSSYTLKLLGTGSKWSRSLLRISFAGTFIGE